MSKELEPIEALDKLLDGYSKGMARRSYYDIVREELQRLESIDNATTSEALECLENLFSNVVSTTYSRESSLKDFNTIKKVLIKEQEQKQYLKWVDLDFKEEEQTVKVILNESKYKVAYFTDGITEYVDLLTDDERLEIIGRYVDDNPHEKQFFNDLHLEVIE